MPSFVLITGCSPGGIGHSLAKEYHSRGAHVFATARRLEVLNDLKSLGMTTSALDVTKPESIRAARDVVVEKTGGKLDVLVNNAGQSYRAPGVESDLSSVRAVFESNLFGVIAMVQDFTPLLLIARGQIINIGSIGGLIPSPFTSAYNASKAALHSYTETLQLELSPFGVRVITVITGVVSSNMNPRSDEPAPFNAESIYDPIREVYTTAAAATFASHAPMPSDEYARRVINRTFGRVSVSGQLYIGGSSTLAWFMSWLVPRWLVVNSLSSAYGLDKLAGLITMRRKNL